jgi:hypothetical protein
MVREAAVNPSDQLLRTKGISYVFVDSRPQGSNRKLLGTLRRNQKQANFSITLPNPVCQVQSYALTPSTNDGRAQDYQIRLLLLYSSGDIGLIERLYDVKPLANQQVNNSVT